MILDATRPLVPPSHFQMDRTNGSFATGGGRPRHHVPKILVVDDKVDTLVLLRGLLTSRGYEVVTAVEADEAKERIISERPDLVLLDVIMPGRSGYDLCHELKSNALTRLIPVVMITGL